MPCGAAIPSHAGRRRIISVSAGGTDAGRIGRTVAITSRMLGQRGKRQAEKLGIDPRRVPPGQYLTERFPVLTVGPNPAYDLESRDLHVFGDVENELRLSWDELVALPQCDVVTDIHCVTLAHTYAEEPLGHDHGAPLRLL